MREIIIAGNWKMYKTRGEAEILASEIKGGITQRENVEMVLFPPFTSLESVGKVLEGSFIQLGAQNMFYEEEGAFTGEISPLMLKAVGCKYVILGHSERRKYFRESDEFINKKLHAALKNGLIPILCVGENLEEREENKAEEVVAKQLRGGLKNWEGKEKVVVAYEPVWAIGTGRTATPEIAGNMHSFIRGVLGELVGNLSKGISILYGGSVKPNNVDELMREDEIDGVLVGGASLKADSFIRIYNFSF
ncbi:MAG: triose-phosphate isomerase [Caldiserica bacterium]|nr:triose-phosphate isomerase [Caldisericota bacterium]